MPRPKKCRNVENFPEVRIFKPDGEALTDLEPIILGFEELEALRLVDFEAKKHEEAAQIMNISRATFGRIIEKARYIVTNALLNGKAIVIEGGQFCCQDMTKANKSIELTEFFIQKQKRCLTCAKYLAMHDIPSNAEISKI